ncbi:hypothetical protein PSSY5922_23255 [Pseudomonas synxantha]
MGVNQMPVAVRQLHQNQAQQRWPGQVERLLRLRLGQGIKGRRHRLMVAPVEHAERQLHLAMYHLLGLRPVARPDEAGTQDVLGVDRGLPGGTKTCDVQPLHIDAHLVDVIAGVLLVKAVKQHALLHRRQGVQVFGLGAYLRQRIQLGLADAGQGEIRRRRLPGFKPAAMGNHRLEFASIVVSQLLDRRARKHLTAEPPLQGQFAAVNLPLDRQPVGQRRKRVLGPTVAFGGRHEQRAFVELAVELPKVVERDARLGQRRQGRDHGWRGQVAQHAVANAFVRHRMQLFLERLDRV